MQYILYFLLAYSIVRCLSYKVALKALGIYHKKNGYRQPTDDELDECSRIALKELFKLKGK